MFLQGNLPWEFKESGTLLGRFWRGEDLKKGKGEKEGEFSFSARRFFFGKSGTESTHSEDFSRGQSTHWSWREERRRKIAKKGIFLEDF